VFQEELIWSRVLVYFIQRGEAPPA